MSQKDFLINSIPKKKYEILDLRWIFCFCCTIKKLNTNGLDSKTMVDFGNNQISENIKFEKEKGFYNTIINSDDNLRLV